MIKLNKFTDYPDGGVYLLKIYLAKKVEIKVGALGKNKFPAGYYFYAGTAQKNLGARIKRHYSNDKNNHWHIDYLLVEAELVDNYIFDLPKKGECFLTDFLKENGAEFIVEGFGASDCSCKSHLSYFSEDKVNNVIKLIENNDIENKFRQQNI